MGDYSLEYSELFAQEVSSAHTQPKIHKSRGVAEMTVGDHSSFGVTSEGYQPPTTLTTPGVFRPHAPATLTAHKLPERIPGNPRARGSYLLAKLSALWVSRGPFARPRSVGVRDRRVSYPAGDGARQTSAVHRESSLSVRRERRRQLRFRFGGAPDLATTLVSARRNRASPSDRGREQGIR